jgi:hypothetical protein
MGLMNKEFEYRGYTFNIKVEVNHTVNRHLGGISRHKVTLNDMGPSNYYETRFCISIELPNCIDNMTGVAKKWVDKQLDNSRTEEEELLISLGFN